MVDRYTARYEVIELDGRLETIERIYTPKVGELPIDMAEDFRKALEKITFPSRVKMTHFDLVGRVKSS